MTKGGGLFQQEKIKTRTYRFAPGRVRFLLQLLKIRVTTKVCLEQDRFKKYLEVPVIK